MVRLRWARRDRHEAGWIVPQVGVRHYARGYAKLGATWSWQGVCIGLLLCYIIRIEILVNPHNGAILSFRRT